MKKSIVIFKNFHVVYVSFRYNFMQTCFIYKFFVHYQSLQQNWTHMCNILATFFDILEIKITDEDSDQTRKV